MQAKPKSARKPSAMKRARQSEKRNLRNRAAKSELKTLSKNVADAVTKKDKDLIKQSLRKATKANMSAASKGVIHKNTASRKISRLSKLAQSAPTT